MTYFFQNRPTGASSASSGRSPEPPGDFVKKLVEGWQVCFGLSFSNWPIGRVDRVQWTYALVPRWFCKISRGFNKWLSKCRWHILWAKLWVRCFLEYILVVWSVEHTWRIMADIDPWAPKWVHRVGQGSFNGATLWSTESLSSRRWAHMVRWDISKPLSPLSEFV